MITPSHWLVLLNVLISTGGDEVGVGVGVGVGVRVGVLVGVKGIPVEVKMLDQALLPDGTLHCTFILKYTVGVPLLYRLLVKGDEVSAVDAPVQEV